MKNTGAYYLVVVLALLMPALLCATENKKQFTVVIDAGHGGRDYGCEGKLTNEKTIVLDVALKLGELITAEHPEVKVVYTRSDDRFVELSGRAAIANRAHADLFISIHVNSIDRKTKGRENIHGASVYTLGLHRSDDNLAVAMRENSVIELEPDFSETYQGFDPSSSESYIIFELTQNVHQRNSIELAESIRDALVSTAGRADKGVLQSGFLVLRATSMPSVLVELDFICNPEAERFLHSTDGRRKCARSLADAFTSYYNKHRNHVNTGSVATPAQTSSNITYRVQFLTSEKPLKNSDRRLQGLDAVEFYRHGNLYKYTSGNFATLDEAKQHLTKVKKIFPEAFIIKMRDGERIQ